MRKQYTYKPVALRFRRWSRKRYAAFISIQHAVTIGQLSANVSERFQAKNGSVHTSVLTFDKVNDGETEEKENTSRLFKRHHPVPAPASLMSCPDRKPTCGIVCTHIVCTHNKR